MKKILKLAVITLPIIVVSAHVRVDNDIIARDSISDNIINSPLDLPEKDYEYLQNIYDFYYRKLNIHGRDSYSKNKVYNRVGIVEPDSFETNYLFLKDKEKININQVTKKTKYDNHGYAVTSIIGTDTGINKNAYLYYEDLSSDEENGNDILEKVKKLHENHGIKLINLSLGWGYNPLRIAIPNGLPSIKKESDLEEIGRWDAYMFLTIGKLISFYHYLNNKEYKNNVDGIFKKTFDEVGQYALKNDIKIVKSGGNFNSANLFELIKQFEEYWSNIEGSKWAYFKDNLSKFKKIINTDPIFKGDKNAFKFLNSYFNNKTSITESSENSFENIISKILADKNEFISVANQWTDIAANKNFINVAAIEVNRTPTYFSSFSDIKTDHNPLVSNYGESLIKENKDFNYKNPFLTKEFKEKIDYLANFSGTSKAAPLVTGMLSLLQNKLKRNLSIAEAKTLLSAESIYSSVKIEKHPYYHKNLTVEDYEIWRQNKSKSKTGFGIPDLYYMNLGAKRGKLRNIRFNKSNSSITSGDDPFEKFILKEPETINIDKDFNHLTHTITITTKISFFEYLKLHHNKFVEATNLFDPEINDKYNINSRLTYTMPGHSGIITRKRKSYSKTSDVEKVYYKKQDYFGKGKLTFNILLNELVWYDNWFKKYSNYEEHKNFIIKEYEKYVKQYFDVATYVDID